MSMGPTPVNQSTADLVTTAGPIPVRLKGVTCCPIVAQSELNDSTFNYWWYMRQSDQAAQTGVLAYTVVTQADQFLVRDEMFLWLNMTMVTLQDPTSLPINVSLRVGPEPQAMFSDYGCWYNMFSSATVSVNKSMLQTVPSPYVPQIACANTHFNPNNVLADRVDYVYRNRVQRFAGDMEIHNKFTYGDVFEKPTYTFWTQNQPTTTTGVTVWVRVPLMQFMYTHTTPNMWMTPQEQVTYNFYLLTPGDPSLTFTLANIVPSIPTATLNTTTPVTIKGSGGQIASLPYKATINQAYICSPLVTVDKSIVAAVAALNNDRPLAQHYFYPQTIVDERVQNYGLGATQLDVPLTTNCWGMFLQRSLIRATGPLPTVFECMPIVTLQWTNAWGVAGYTWTRKLIVPNLVYIRRAYLGGQELAQDPLLTQASDSQLTEPAIWDWATQWRLNRTRQIEVSKNQVDMDHVKGWDKHLFSSPHFLAIRSETDPAAAVLAARLAHVSKAWFQQLMRGPNLFQLGQNPGLSQLIDYRSEQLSVDMFIAPVPATLDANTEALLPFAYADVVMPGLDNMGADTPSPPTSASLTIYWMFAYQSEYLFGAGRTSAYAYLTPMLTNLQQTIPT